jgi:hypothetical protein
MERAASRAGDIRMNYIFRALVLLLAATAASGATKKEVAAARERAAVLRKQIDAATRGKSAEEVTRLLAVDEEMQRRLEEYERLVQSIYGSDDRIEVSAAAAAQRPNVLATGALMYVRTSASPADAVGLQRDAATGT